jgi:enoyl-CoA hydratase/carnithine racemase
VAPPERLDAVTQELVDELLGCAPVAVGLAKRLIDASARPALSTTLELELAAQELCARTEDVKEGVRAAAERRPANFSGR